MRTLNIIFLAAFLSGGNFKLHSQNVNSFQYDLTIPDNLLEGLKKKSLALEKHLQTRTKHYLHRLRREEEKLKKLLYKKILPSQMIFLEMQTHIFRLLTKQQGK